MISDIGIPSMLEKDIYIKTRELVDSKNWTSAQAAAATAQQALNALKIYWPEITTEQQAEFIFYYPRIQIHVVEHLTYKENLVMVATLLNKLTPTEKRWIRDNVLSWNINIDSILQDIQDGVIH